MKDFTTNELYYVAGLLEGEGSFSYHHNSKGYLYLDIKLKMTDKDIVEWLADKWECSVCTEHFDNHYKTAYITQLRRKAEALQFLGMIHPLMGKRRQERIDQMVAMCYGS